MLSWDSYPSLPSMSRERAWIEIDSDALAHNVRQIKRLLSPATELMVMVKADAYGHGAVTVARTVLQQGATWLGVATIPEGIELRDAGIRAPILLLGAVNTAEQVKAIAHWQLQPTLCNAQQALLVSQTLDTIGNGIRLPVHLNVDTGMSRLGIPYTQAPEFATLVNQLPHLTIASIYSHLATADSLDRTTVDLQQSRYQDTLTTLASRGIIPPWLHLANSAATLTDPMLHYNLVRVGLAIYGLYPAPHLQSVADLRPVLQVRARVTQVKTIPAGTGVSYGHHYIADRDLRMAVVGLGYADGVPRQLSNQMTALIHGCRVRQIGMITMDQLMVDVSAIPNVREGDVVTFLGVDGVETISAEDWATTLDTISWEILCGFKHRLPRVVLSPLEENLPTYTARRVPDQILIPVLNQTDVGIINYKAT